MRFKLSYVRLDPGYPSDPAKGDAERAERFYASKPSLRVQYGINLLCLLLFFIIVPGIYSNAFAQLNISTTGVAFGNVAVGSSATRQVYLTCSGRTSVTVSQVSVTGGPFSISSLAVPLILTWRKSAVLNVTYLPTAAGVSSGTLTVTSGAENNRREIKISGSGVSLLLGASPTSLSFGNLAVGSSSAQTVTLTNSGASSITVSKATVTGTGFSASGLLLPATVAAGQSTTFSVTYAPTAAGSATASLSVVSNAVNSPATIALSGTGGTLLLGASPTSLSFGTVTVGSSSAQTVMLTNSGTNSVTISALTATGTGFNVSGLSLPATVAAGQSAAFNVTYAPTVAGSLTGSLSVVSNATNSPATISISGTAGTLLLGASPTSLSFGSAAVGSSSAQTVTLTNSGTGSVTVSALTATGTGFTASGLSLPATVAAGQSTTFSVTYAPTAAGSASGSVSVVSTATNSPATIALAGTGTTVLVAVSPTTLNFGSVMVNNTSSQSITLQNTGTASVTLSQATVAGTGFSLSGLSLPATLAAGKSTSLTVTFTPTATGSATGSLTLVSNASNSPASVALDGVGAATHTVDLSWVASTSSDIAGYNVYRGTVSGGPYTLLTSSLVTTTTYADGTVLSGATYYYVTTAVDSEGNASAYSDQVQAVVPSP